MFEGGDSFFLSMRCLLIDLFLHLRLRRTNRKKDPIFKQEGANYAHLETLSGLIEENGEQVAKIGERILHVDIFKQFLTAEQRANFNNEEVHQFISSYCYGHEEAVENAMFQHWLGVVQFNADNLDGLYF